MTGSYINWFGKLTLGLFLLSLSLLLVPSYPALKVHLAAYDISMAAHTLSEQVLNSCGTRRRVNQKFFFSQ